MTTMDVDTAPMLAVREPASPSPHPGTATETLTAPAVPPALDRVMAAVRRARTRITRRMTRRRLHPALRATPFDWALTGCAITLAAAGIAIRWQAPSGPDPVIGQVAAIGYESPPATVVHDLLTGYPVVLEQPGKLIVSVRWPDGEVIPVSMPEDMAARCSVGDAWRLASECGR